MSIFSNILKGRNPTGGSKPAKKPTINEAGNASASLKQTDTDIGGLGGVQRQIASAFSPGSQLPGDNAEAEEARTGRRMNRNISDTIRNQRISSRFGSGFGRGAF